MTRTILALTLAAAIAAAATASSATAPTRHLTAVPGQWEIRATATGSAGATARLWASVPKIGADGRVLRAAATLDGVAVTLRARCSATTAPIAWWVDVDGVRGPTATHKCR